MTILHDDELTPILLDDCPFSDPTAEDLGIDTVPRRATLTALHDMEACGVEEAGRRFELAWTAVRLAARSGAPVAAGDHCTHPRGCIGFTPRTVTLTMTFGFR